MKKLFHILLHFQYGKFASTVLQGLGNLLHNLLFRLLLPKSWRSATKKQIYTVIFESKTPAGKKFDIYLLVAIGINLLLLIIETLPYITGWASTILRILEWAFTLAFTFEYYLRIYCLRKPKDYVLSFYGIIDVLSIFPAYLSIFFPATQTLSVLRILRALRIFRILQKKDFIKEGTILIRSLRASAYRIGLFMLFTFLASIILGALMFMFENPYNPAFKSIPEGIYWAVVTITTVGYGDITPVTMAGRFISVVVMLLGYSIIAIPTGIIAGEVAKGKDEKKKKKPHEEEQIPTFLDDEFADNEDEVRSTLETDDDDDDDDMDKPVKRCPQCSHEESDEGAEFCSRCGSRLNKIEDHSWMNDFFAKDK